LQKPAAEEYQNEVTERRANGTVAIGHSVERIHTLQCIAGQEQHTYAPFTRTLRVVAPRWQNFSSILLVQRSSAHHDRT